MRRRYLSTNISVDKDVNRLAMTGNDFAALLYTWMIPHAGDDGTLTGDVEEFAATVCPMRRDKSLEEVETALQVMHDLDLILWDRAGNIIRFPESFFKYQTYIGETRRGAGGGTRARNGDEAASPVPLPPLESPRTTTPHNAAQQRKSAQSTAHPRATPQNSASSSSSSSSSLSVKSSSSSSGGTGGSADGTDATPVDPGSSEEEEEEDSSQSERGEGSAAPPDAPLFPWYRFPGESASAYVERGLSALPAHCRPALEERYHLRVQSRGKPTSPWGWKASVVEGWWSGREELPDPPKSHRVRAAPPSPSPVSDIARSLADKLSASGPSPPGPPGSPPGRGISRSETPEQQAERKCREEAEIAEAQTLLSVLATHPDRQAEFDAPLIERMEAAEMKPGKLWDSTLAARRLAKAREIVREAREDISREISPSDTEEGGNT